MISPATLADALSKAASSPKFGTEAWLTFYLSGDSRSLTALAHDLAALGARNLDGATGGCIYAKMPVSLDADDVQRVAQQAAILAEQHKVMVDHIDLDSSSEVGSSKFFCLIKGRR